MTPPRNFIEDGVLILLNAIFEIVFRLFALIK
jgi:hypothetical protein